MNNKQSDKFTDSKALVVEYIEKVWNKADFSALEHLTTPSFFYKLGGQPNRDRIELQQFIVVTHTAFPDWHVKIVEIISEKDTVVVRWEGQVTHKGTFQGIPPTGKQIMVMGINLY